MASEKKSGKKEKEEKAETGDAAAGNAAADAPAAGASDPIAKGDIVYLSYDATSVGSNDLIETTDKEKAEGAGIMDPLAGYGPRAFIVGKGEPVPGLDDDLLHAKVGEARTLELAPAKAYGDRDARLVEIHNKNELLRLPEYRREGHYHEPEVGDRLTIRNRTGTVTAVTGGRVRIDFNTPHAGKTLRYSYTVTSKASAPADRVKAVIDLHYGRSDEFTIEMRGTTEAHVVLPDRAKIDPAWHGLKLRIVADLRGMAGLAKVQFVEEYVKREAPGAVPSGTPADAKEHDHDHEHDHKGHDHDHDHAAHPAQPEP